MISPRDKLLRSAAVLEARALEFRDSYTVQGDGSWPADVADEKAEHDEMVRLAESLRQIAAAQECKVEPFWSGVCSRGTAACRQEHAQPSAQPVARAIEVALSAGYTPQEILDENSPIRSEIRAAASAQQNVSLEAGDICPLCNAEVGGSKHRCAPESQPSAPASERFEAWWRDNWHQAVPQSESFDEARLRALIVWQAATAALDQQ